jgi:hypothetical protein
MPVHYLSRMASFLRMIQYQSVRVERALQMPSLGIFHPHRSFDGGLALFWSTTKMIKPPFLPLRAAVLRFACAVPEEYQKPPKGEVFSLQYSQMSRQHWKEKYHDSWCRGSRKYI